MWDDYAKSIGTTRNNLTQAQKIQAEVNGILEETKFQTGDAAKIAGTYSGQVSSLGYTFQNFKVAVGNALIPIAQAVLPGINAVITALTTLANVFAKVTALLFGKSVSTASPQAKVQEEIAVSGEAAADSTDKLADSTAGAGKAAKQAAKDMKGVLANFDELNILQSQTASGGSSGASGAGAGDIALPEIAPGGELFEDVEVNDEIEKAIQRIIDELNRLKGILKSGFDFGFGNADFGPVLKSIANIGKRLKDIFTAKNVQEAAQNFIDSFVFAIGALAGSLTSVGITLMSAVFGGFEAYLSENSERIKLWLIQIFNVGAEITALIAQFAKAFAEVFSVFGDENAQAIIASILQIFGDIFGSVILLAEKFARDIIGMFTNPFVKNAAKMKQTLEGFLEPFVSLTKSVSEAVRTAVDEIVKLYDDHIQPLIKTAEETYTEWVEHILDGFNTYIKPVLDDFAELFEQTVNDHIVPMIEKASGFFGTLADTIRTIWDNVIGPFVTFMIDTFSPLIGDALEFVLTEFNRAITVISDVVGSILQVLQGLLQFITGVFTGDWSKAWEGIKNIFKGVWNGIVSLLESAINFIINGINGLIRKLNMFKFSVPDWVPRIGGSSFGINISPLGSVRLPRLANGAVIPPNQQFAAILGDQRSGKNIEAPAGLIENIVSRAVSEAMASGGRNQPIQVNVMLDKKVLARAMVNEVNDMTRSAGRPVLVF